MLVVAASVAFAAGTTYYIYRGHDGGPERTTVSTATGEGDSGSPQGTSIRVGREPDETVVVSPIRFQTISPECGIDFKYYGAPTDLHHMTEQNGGGVALFDYDGDGRLDVFLVNGSSFERPAEAVGASNRMFRSIQDDDRPPRYADATADAGLAAYGFGMGCTAGDYDNDGFTDLFVAYYGRNRLWRNNGDGTFDEVTAEAGVEDELWGTSAAWADLDADGDLDLYVVNYVDWSSEEPPCTLPGDPPVRAICSPLHRNAQPDRLYENLGEGRFREVGAEAGVANTDAGKGLALAVADLDDDGLLDVYVANDTSPNSLFRNQGGLRFEDVGIAHGAAIGGSGDNGASMGVACGDYNRDGRLDLAVTNFRSEPNDVYMNLGQARFITQNTELGMAFTQPALSFGIVLCDFDLDTWPDLFIANGHIWNLESKGPGYEYKMMQHLLLNRGGRRFVDASAATGAFFEQRRLARSAASGDLDNDGDVDMVVGCLDEPTAVLQNESRRGGNALMLRLIGVESSRQPLGARVFVRCNGDAFTSWVPAGGSFQAAHDDRLIIAIGDQKSADEVHVYWPRRDAEIYRDVPAGGLQYLVEGGSRYAAAQLEVSRPLPPGVWRRRRPSAARSAGRLRSGSSPM